MWASACVCACVYFGLIKRVGVIRHVCMWVFYDNKLRKLQIIIKSYNGEDLVWGWGGGFVFLVNDLASPNFIQNAGLYH